MGVQGIKSRRDWRCEVEKRIVRDLPTMCRLWLPMRNVPAPGHEKCGFTNMWTDRKE